MESQWIPETSESDFRGQNSMACGIVYITGKLLERRCSKWAHIAHLDIWNTSYGQKKGRKSNDALLSSLLDPLEGLGVLNCGKLELGAALDFQH